MQPVKAVNQEGVPAIPAPPAGETDVRRPRGGWIIALLTVAALMVWSVWWWRPWAGDGRTAPLVPIATAPDFTLTERSGRTVAQSDLLGHVWVADFIFTTCAGPCPELSLRMRSLQKDLKRFAPHVKLVSFTVDPLHDQPPVLRMYADHYGADPDLWWFLTCDSEPRMYELVQKGFLQALSPASGGAQIIHSTRFLLVDRGGKIRATYDGLDPASKKQILRDVQRLLREPAGS